MTTGTSPAGYNLALETSGRWGGVALGFGPQIMAVRTFSAVQRHAVELLPTIDALCKGTSLAPEAVEEVYVSAGPGSFTGLRIGITVARTLAWAGHARVVCVPTLEAIAQNAATLDPPPKHVGVVLDAKRRKVFAEAFVWSPSEGRYRSLRPPYEWDPDEFLGHLPRPAVVMGEGVPAMADAIGRQGLPVLADGFHRARAEVVYRMGHALGRLGQFTKIGDVVPVYVRRPEAEEVWERRPPPTAS